MISNDKSFYLGKRIDKLNEELGKYLEEELQEVNFSSSISTPGYSNPSTAPTFGKIYSGYCLRDCFYLTMHFHNS